MLAFLEVQDTRNLLKIERLQPDRFTMFFTYGDERLPVIKGLNFDSDSAFVIETSEKKDTILIGCATPRWSTKTRCAWTLLI